MPELRRNCRGNGGAGARAVDDAGWRGATAKSSEREGRKIGSREDRRGQLSSEYFVSGARNAAGEKLLDYYLEGWRVLDFYDPFFL